MRVDVITILPEIFRGPMSASMVGLAREKGFLDFHVHDLRDWTTDRHRTTDDYPYGGGPGMVMKPEPLFAAVRDVVAMDPANAHVIFLSPSGTRHDQRLAEDLSVYERLIFVCGRYEGFDERALKLADMQLSIGDFVLTGGELAAMVVIDSVIRLVPGVLGHKNSTAEESFTTGLLEYPQYTRPPEFEGMTVPDVLLSGDHARIARYRREQAIRVTAQRRPDLLDSAELTEEEQIIAWEAIEGSTTCD
ncbi:MAG: tRNA (guanosine(37)-N1)-methyltransferase TrmD [Coriobacteriia bacterium]|nr:tRNA (guanosine(37)-N1)-methyltransferase TrmD [Coriobacteriia bacterium]